MQPAHARNFCWLRKQLKLGAHIIYSTSHPSHQLIHLEEILLAPKTLSTIYEEHCCKIPMLILDILRYCLLYDALSAVVNGCATEKQWDACSGVLGKDVEDDEVAKFGW